MEASSALLAAALASPEGCPSTAWFPWSAALLQARSNDAAETAAEGSAAEGSSPTAEAASMVAAVTAACPSNGEPATPGTAPGTAAWELPAGSWADCVSCAQTLLHIEHWKEQQVTQCPRRFRTALHEGGHWPGV